MKFANVLAVLTAALTTASAAPSPASDSGSASGDNIKEIVFKHPFYLTTSTSTLKNQRVSANNGGFWVGKPTTSKCNPKVALDYCPTGNETIFNDIQEGNLALASFGRFDQRGPNNFVYIDGQRTYLGPKGAWGFVDRDNKGAPAGSTFDGWMYYFGVLSHRDAQGNPGGKVPFACPVGAAYRLYFAPGSAPPSDKCESVVLKPVTLYGAGTYV